MAGFYRAISKMEQWNDAECHRQRDEAAFANGQKSLVHDRDFFAGFMGITWMRRRASRTKGGQNARL
jgi:hypothetical protein